MSELLNSRNSVLAAFRRKIRKVSIPDVGTLLIRPLTGSQRARLADAHKTAGEKTQLELTRDIQCQVVAWALVDEAGERLFGDAETEQIAEAFDAPALDALSLEILRASGLAAGSVGDAEKNSESTPTGSSPSDSASGSGVPTLIDSLKSSTQIN